MLITVLCVLGILGTRAAEYQYLVFTLNSGETKAVAATSLNISFNDGNLIATSGSETLATLALADLTKMEFSNDDTTGIESISADTLTTDENTVIYDLNGRMMPKGTALPKGIYILKNSNKTIKMQIK